MQLASAVAKPCLALWTAIPPPDRCSFAFLAVAPPFWPPIGIGWRIGMPISTTLNHSTARPALRIDPVGHGFQVTGPYAGTISTEMIHLQSSRYRPIFPDVTKPMRWDKLWLAILLAETEITVASTECTCPVPATISLLDFGPKPLLN